VELISFDQKGTRGFALHPMVDHGRCLLLMEVISISTSSVPVLTLREISDVQIRTTERSRNPVLANYILIFFLMNDYTVIPLITIQPHIN